LVTGTGIGNFSSKLAFRATAMNVTGSYPAKFAYINDDFKLNHLDLYAYYFAGKDDFHSVVNSPDSTYDQLLSEYGLAGLFSFACFYIAFFVQKLTRNASTIPLILLMLGVFFIEYWFEHLSVIVFFELLLFVNIKEITEKKIETA
jgi:O-antigen ligase